MCLVKSVIKIEHKNIEQGYAKLSPCVDILFPKIKTHLRGCHLGNVESMQQNVTSQLKTQHRFLE